MLFKNATNKGMVSIMKYIIILGDGMADYPVDELCGKTPLEAAAKPAIDALAAHALCGMIRTVPEGMPPGSDTANLSVMGYDPAVYYSGRSPLEAVSMGIDMASEDISYRCNIVYLEGEDAYEDGIMRDYSCDEIPTEESEVLIRYLNDFFQNDTIHLYPGISYRHCLLLKNTRTGSATTPPHDISDRCVRDYLPSGANGELLLSMMKKSRELLKNHPINQSRIERGLRPATSLWFWGEGVKPNLPTYQEKYGIRGSVVSAVDLIRGIGICAGLDIILVEGATGTIHTNFRGKAQAAIDAVKNGQDFVYVHLEAPDECGHRHEVENKVLSIEKIDNEVVTPILLAMREMGEDFRMLVLPDHPTPLSLRTHVADPVPFLLYDSTKKADEGISSYTESNAAKTGVFIEKGHDLMTLLIKGCCDGTSFC